MQLVQGDFSDATLVFTDFRNGDLRFAHFDRINRRLAQIGSDDRPYHATLWFDGATLSDVNFDSAFLPYASFRGSHLERAILSGANIDRADFRGATGLSVEQVKAAVHWESATYDSDFRILLDLPPQSIAPQPPNQGSFIIPPPRVLIPTPTRPAVDKFR